MSASAHVREGEDGLDRVVPSAFELATGQPRSLPAWEPVATYPVEIIDGMVRVTVD